MGASNNPDVRSLHVSHCRSKLLNCHHKYNDAANTISRLIAAAQSSNLVFSSKLPITKDAEASCRSSSSSRRMIRITEPSKASVKFITSMNLAPEAHSYLFGSVCEHLVSVFGVNEFVMCASDEYLCACVFGVEERL